MAELQVFQISKFWFLLSSSLPGWLQSIDNIYVTSWTLCSLEISFIQKITPLPSSSSQHKASGDLWRGVTWVASSPIPSEFFLLSETSVAYPQFHLILALQRPRDHMLRICLEHSCTSQGAPQTPQNSFVRQIQRFLSQIVKVTAMSPQPPLLFSQSVFSYCNKVPEINN